MISAENQGPDREPSTYPTFPKIAHVATNRKRDLSLGIAGRGIVER